MVEQQHRAQEFAEGRLNINLMTYCPNTYVIDYLLSFSFFFQTIKKLLKIKLKIIFNKWK